MLGYQPHTVETKELILKLFDEGKLTAREIANKVNILHKHIIPQKLTRNSCLGIKNRAGKCIPTERKYTYSKRDKYGYDKSVAFNEMPEKISLFEKRIRKLRALLQ